MRSTAMTVHALPNQEVRTRAEQLGYVAKLMAHCPAYASLPLSYLNNVFGPALEHRQLKVYFDRDGKPAGFVAWAWLAPDVELRMVQGECGPLHPSEWNEGGVPWILEFAAPHGHLKSILADLRDTVFGDQARLRYRRACHGQLRCLEMVRDGQSAFFRCGGTATPRHP
jgi:cytolysin-activating lysine-acyltransferase